MFDYFFQKNKYGSKCLKLPKSSRNTKKNFEKISRTFKSTTISRTFKVRLLAAQQKFRPIVKKMTGLVLSGDAIALFYEYLPTLSRAWTHTLTYIESSVFVLGVCILYTYTYTYLYRDHLHKLKQTVSAVHARKLVCKMVTLSFRYK